MRGDGRAGGAIDESGLEVDERRERGDEDGERHQHRDDGEGEAEKPSCRDGQRDPRSEREHEREEGANGPVEQERRSDHQGAEERKVADGCGAGFALDPRLDVRHADLADRSGARTRKGGVDGGKRAVALRRAVHVQIHHHGEEPISEKALLAEEFRSCGQPPQLRQRRAGPRAADRIEDGEGAEVGHCS